MKLELLAWSAWTTVLIFLFISNVLARAEADANVKSQLSAQIVSLKAAMEQENEDLKISQKSMLTDDIATADA